jgi:NAD(P)-dependent dehydrogenase (short-subunit alcohol dehydrogenase family)
MRYARTMTTTWFESGHVAIVTGSSKGLGKATARRLLQHGLRVIIDGRDRDGLEAARAELDRFGEIVAIPGNVADKDHVHQLIAAAKSFGRLDLLINNASTLGQTPLPRIDQLSEPVFDELFTVNVFAPIHLMQHALPLMLRGNVATIVNITSDAAAAAYPGWGGYGASKAALEHLSRVFAEELSQTPVRVLVVDPGDMNTEMHRAAVPDADPASLIDPDDAAGALVDAIAKADGRFARLSLGVLASA